MKKNPLVEYLRNQPCLQTIQYRQPPLTAWSLANILSWAYNGLGLQHLDKQAEKNQK